MCGLVGFARTSKASVQLDLSNASASLAHRGPDGSGEYLSVDGRVGMSFRRLAMLDLSQSGDQPMHLVARGLSIIFNGEIYNWIELRRELIDLGYSFTSGSDCEVLITAWSAWEEKCLNRLNGSFSFAIFNSVTNELFLARDRAGEKPCFYCYEHGVLCFASELKAMYEIAGGTRRINMLSLDYYLAMGHVPGATTMLQGYKKLPPAHILRFELDTGKLRTYRYWDLPRLDQRAGFTCEKSLEEELERLLENAVARQFRADARCGIFLSGGVDSSLVTAMAARSQSKVYTFSAGFPGYGKYNETDYARLVSNFFGTEHTEIMISPDLGELILNLLHQSDEPLADSSTIPFYIVSRIARKTCKAALSGDGADELFGGYKHYSRLLSLARISLPSSLRGAITYMSEHLLPVGFKGRGYLQNLAFCRNSGLPITESFFDSKERSILLKELPSHETVAENLFLKTIDREVDIVQRATRTDFRNYLAEDILVKADRASMMASLEMRAPFLDVELIDFAFRRVPSRLKATTTGQKILIKKLAAKILPKEFDSKRKQGFSCPLGGWLKQGALRDLFWDILTSKDCVFDKKAVRRVLIGQDQGRRNHERLFALVQFELWRKTHRASF